MNYKFLAKEEITKFFEESELSTAQIIDILYLTKFDLEKKSKTPTDKLLYEAIEKSTQDILEDSIIDNNKEWRATVEKIFKIEEDERK